MSDPPPRPRPLDVGDPAAAVGMLLALVVASVCEALEIPPSDE